MHRWKGFLKILFGISSLHLSWNSLKLQNSQCKWIKPQYFRYCSVFWNAKWQNCERKVTKLWIIMYIYWSFAIFRISCKGTNVNFIFEIQMIYRLQVQSDWNSWARLWLQDRVPLFIHCQIIVLSGSFDSKLLYIFFSTSLGVVELGLLC